MHIRTISIGVIIVLALTGVLSVAQDSTRSDTVNAGKKTGEGKATNRISIKANSTRVSYKKTIAPIFHKYCLPCHTEDQMNPSELYLDSYEGLMKGGKHGVPVVPHNADSSIMVRKINKIPPFGDPMPLKRKTPFPQDTLKILKDWINQGGKDN